MLLTYTKELLLATEEGGEGCRIGRKVGLQLT